MDNYRNSVQRFAVAYLEMLHLKYYMRSESRSLSPVTRHHRSPGSAPLHETFVAVSLAQNLVGMKPHRLLSLRKPRCVQVEARVWYCIRILRTPRCAQAEPLLIFDGQAGQTPMTPTDFDLYAVNEYRRKRLWQYIDLRDRKTTWAENPAKLFAEG
jgi:hypothetical protein